MLETNEFTNWIKELKKNERLKEKCRDLTYTKSQVEKMISH